MKREAKAFPARMADVGESPLHFAKRRIVMVPIREPIKAKVVVRYGLFINMASLLWECTEPAFSTTIAKAAPKAAPCDIPKVKGEAKGFLNMLCITAPDIERIIPAMIAEIILGSLTFKRIKLLLSTSLLFIKADILEKEREEITSPIVKLYVPMHRAYNEKIRRNTRRKLINKSFLLVYFRYPSKILFCNLYSSKASITLLHLLINGFAYQKFVNLIRFLFRI